MTRVRKTIDLWDIEGLYDLQTGWEVLCTEYSRYAAAEQLRAYRVNDPGFRFRCKKRRQKKTEFEPAALEEIEREAAASYARWRRRIRSRTVNIN